MRKHENILIGVVMLALSIAFVVLVLSSSDDTGPEWSGVSHVDGRN